MQSSRKHRDHKSDEPRDRKTARKKANKKSAAGSHNSADTVNRLQIRLNRDAETTGRDADHAPTDGDTYRVRNIVHSSGKPLDPVTRELMQERLGADLSHVRLHTGAQPAESAQSLDAEAYTVGRDIVFGEGRYQPDTPSGKQLLAHELIHVLQQGSASPIVEGENLEVSHPSDPSEQEADRLSLKAIEPRGRAASAEGAITAGVARDGGGVIQRQVPAPTPTPATTPVGTPADAARLITTTRLARDPTLVTALGLLSRYSQHVPVRNIQFRVFATASASSRLGAGLTERARSYWDGNTPVIELAQTDLDTINRHITGTGVPPASDVTDMHAIIRTIGHEVHHLWRERAGFTRNPIQPVYSAEATRRMEQVRQNWLRWIQTGGTGARRELRIPRDLAISTWEDIPQAVRQSIETGASRTDFIEGLYQRSSYLVEEIYTKIEELSFLRVQQGSAIAAVARASRVSVTQLAREIFLLSNILNSMSGGELITPALLTQARSDMLAYLRQRFPNRGAPGFDSFEVIFYLAAIRGGIPPIFSGGRLLSATPPGARVPP